jgi:hypothetical protein
MLWQYSQCWHLLPACAEHPQHSLPSIFPAGLGLTDPFVPAPAACLCCAVSGGGGGYGGGGGGYGGGGYGGGGY